MDEGLRFSAFITTVRFVASVLLHVLLHVHFLGERLAAHVAHEPPAQAVDVHVGRQAAASVQSKTIRFSFYLKKKNKKREFGNKRVSNVIKKIRPQNI